jgi:raffinose/stachyose/melibiose transport system permease protein
MSIQYSFFNWNGIGPMTWVGLNNYLTVLQVPKLLGSIINAFKLVLWFSFIPVGLGLITANLIHRVVMAALAGSRETVLFLPQVIPWLQPGLSGVGCWLCQV